MLDTRRHDRLFDKLAFNEPVHIIGAGSVGSHVARLLAKLGVGLSSPVTVYDGDRVEPHNPPNQAYDNKHIGLLKAEVLRERYWEWSGEEVEAYSHSAFVSSKIPLSGVVFLCLDSMEERRRIARESVWNNPEVKLLIETRTSVTHAMVFALDPNDRRHIKCWERLWYPTPEVPDSGYGGPQSVIISVEATAVFAAQRLVEFSRLRAAKGLINRFWLDVTTGETFSEAW